MAAPENTPPPGRPSRACIDCGAPTGRPLARYCDADRWRHRLKPRRYELTPEREELLRRRYRLSGPSVFARSWGWPRWAVKRRAASLGLTTPNPSKPWTDAEQAFLEEHLGTRSAVWIARKLGRTEGSVAMRCKRQDLRRALSPDGYTCRGLEVGLGIDHRTLAQHVASGRLSVRYRFGGTHPASPTDPWVVSERELMRFLRTHRDAYRLDRVDQEFFMGLLLPPQSVRLAEAC